RRARGCTSGGRSRAITALAPRTPACPTIALGRAAIVPTPSRRFRSTVLTETALAPPSTILCRTSAGTTVTTILPSRSTTSRTTRTIPPPPDRATYERIPLSILTLRTAVVL